MKGPVRPVLLSRAGLGPKGCATVWLRWCIRYSVTMVQAITVVMVPITTGRPDGVGRLNAWHTARKPSRYACGYCTAALSYPHSPQIWASNPMYQDEPSTGRRIEDAAQMWILSRRYGSDLNQSTTLRLQRGTAEAQAQGLQIYWEDDWFRTKEEGCAAREDARVQSVAAKRRRRYTILVRALRRVPISS
jgi:hypothetical protein